MIYEIMTDCLLLSTKQLHTTHNKKIQSLKIKGHNTGTINKSIYLNGSRHHYFHINIAF